MKYPKYENYKDPGIDGIDEVPEHWDIAKVYHLFDLGRGRVISKEEILDNAGKYPVYSSQTEKKGLLGKIDSYDFEGEYLTWTTDGANAGTVFKREGKFNCTNVCGTLSPKKEKLNLLYLKHALSIMTSHYVRKDINPKLMNDVMARINILYPPFKEQKLIAEFLDNETSRIDKLIEKKEKLIELLEEKRQVIITQTVTKGLDPDVPMKESGIECLGEIPKHWDIAKVYHLFELGRGRVISKGEILDHQGEYPVYSSQTEKDGLLGKIDSYDFEGEYLTWTTDGANAGTVFKREGKFNCTNVCGTLKPKIEKLNLKYFKHALSLMTKHYVRKDINPKLMNNVMASINVLYPPVEEQKEISFYLNKKTCVINKLKEKLKKQISNLNEYRQALIKNAVTGKIDVRDLV